MTDIEVADLPIEVPRNPYCPFSEEECAKLAPFTGRRAAFEYLQQQLTAPTNRVAAVILGGRHSGKSTMLHYFRVIFDETYIGVFVPLKHLMLSHEANLLLTLAHTATALLMQLGFLLTRLPSQPDDDSEMREWLADRFLPEIFMVIRPHRRLVFLLDDAEELIDAALLNKTMPPDTFTYLHRLLQQHPQLNLVMTVDTDYEPHLPNVSPLVDAMRTHRLMNMTLEESAWLVQYPPRKLYTVTDEAAAAVHRASGGQPQLLQSYGFHLFNLWQSRKDNNNIVPDDVKAVTPSVYSQSEEEFRWLWGELNRNERLVLTAISGLLYDNPLQSINTSSVETWLIESDYLIDATSINAAIRSLEYREVLTVTGTGVAPSAGLLQKWLLENARVSDQPHEVAGSERAPQRKWLVPLIILVVVIMVGVIAAITFSRAPQSTRTNPPEPTVTLATQE